jgi:hypothetical protein
MGTNFPVAIPSNSQDLKIRYGAAADRVSVRRYHLFLVVSVLFIFLLTTTYWALVIDLADSPGKVSANRE